MVSSVPPNWISSNDGSLLGRLRARRDRHPDEFPCAVRVVSGVVPGESRRWSYRRSAVDLLRQDESVQLTHGSVVLRLVFTGEQHPGHGLRPHHAVWPAGEITTGAEVEIGAEIHHAATFGLL